MLRHTYLLGSLTFFEGDWKRRLKEMPIILPSKWKNPSYFSPLCFPPRGPHFLWYYYSMWSWSLSEMLWWSCRPVALLLYPRPSPAASSQTNLGPFLSSSSCDSRRRRPRPLVLGRIICGHVGQLAQAAAWWHFDCFLFWSCRGGETLGKGQGYPEFSRMRIVGDSSWVQSDDGWAAADIVVGNNDFFGG